MMHLGQTDVGTIERLLIKHVRDAFVSDEAIDDQWQSLGYTARPDLARARDEYDRFVELLTRFDVRLEYLPRDDRVGLDSIYARDASVICDEGAILCNMGKAARRTEPGVQGELLQSLGIPIHGAIEDPGRLEGGDVAWLDERTVAVGRGYRTNDEGICQFAELLEGCVDELITVPLPHWRGPGDVFHLMSIISPIDRDLALVYAPLLPVPFRETLLARGFELVEVPDDEFDSMGCNVLAAGPRRCITVAGNPETRKRLEAAGCEVREFDGREICLKGGGGPTCLTRPFRSAPAR